VKAVVFIIGRPGAGKSTLLRLYQPAGLTHIGSVELNGTDL